MSIRHKNTENLVLDEAGVTGLLNRQVRLWGSNKAAAEALGISPQYLCDAIAGRRKPDALLLQALGYRRVVRFEPIRCGGVA